MLETLQIRDFALIDDVEVQFQLGFNVLTGETGAGKSIVVNALYLVLGGRASAASVRSGRKEAKIDAVFSLDTIPPRLAELFEAHAIEVEDAALHLTRILSSAGRSRAYACGALIPASVLSAIGDELVDLHGQHDHQSLLKTDRQLDLVDAFGGLGAQSLRVAGQVNRLRRIEGELNTLEEDDRERLRRLEFLRFEAEEIDKAALEADEEEDLRGRRARMTNAEELAELRARLRKTLFDNEQSSPALELLSQALSDLERLADIDANSRALADGFARLYSELEAYSDAISAGGEADFDPAELDDINARLSLIAGLKRKYGASVAEVLAYRARIGEELDRFDRKDEHVARLRKERDEVSAKAKTAAEALTKGRRRAVKKLDKEVTGALEGLGMENGTFRANLVAVELSRRGMERAEFLISANAGEEAKPLRQVASGGEISRIMLALKVVFAETDPVPSLIFDEIDSGIGGAVANHVAQALAKLAANHQVICVTHLAQIAATAGAHYHVAKTTERKRTQTCVLEVRGEARVEEVARLLDGKLSGASLEHARTLLSMQRRASA